MDMITIPGKQNNYKKSILWMVEKVNSLKYGDSPIQWVISHFQIISGKITWWIAQVMVLIPQNSLAKIQNNFNTGYLHTREFD